VEPVATWEQTLDERVLAPTQTSGRWYVVWLTFLALVIGWGVVAYLYQWRNGLYVTGMRDRISWGLYISAFVFFIGISHAGTLISAILRASNAGWRSPITRIAESITVVSLVSGALFVIVDMGRPERLYQFWLNGNWQSPLMWDMIAITIYLTASVVYLYVPMIPDLAMFRDQLGGRVNRLQMWVYRTLAIGWNNTELQRRALLRSVGILMLLIIPVAVSVHTVVSWIFAMTMRVTWDSTIFGFFFVSGAIYSGIATLIIVLAVMRKAHRLEEYITPLHFKYLAYLLAVMSLVMIYGNASEYITKGFKMPEEEKFAFEELFAGDFASMYWFYFFGGLVLPLLLVACKPTRNITGIVVAAVFVDIAMFIERYFIVVAGLRVPTMPYEPASYSPTWVEWSILASGFAGFMMLLTLFARFFPILAVWEMKEERAESHDADRGESVSVGAS
jgi:Ni/Fe-hydrogenase subunit HybB-like protein